MTRSDWLYWPSPEVDSMVSLKDIQQRNAFVLASPSEARSTGPLWAPASGNKSGWERQLSK
jgi:hypothetical protein